MQEANVEIRAHIGGGAYAHREELAVASERELRHGQMVAAVRVREERFRAVCSPFHRPCQLPCGPGAGDVFGVQIDLAAKAAADIGRHHAHLVLRQPEHERGHQQPLDVRILARDVERGAVVRPRVDRVHRARLDRIGHEAVVHELELRDVGGLGERGVDGVLVAERPHIAGIVGRALVQRRALLRLRHAHHRRQWLVVDFHEIRGIARLRGGFGDHDGDALADVPYLALRERGVRRLLHRLAVDIGNQPATGQAADFRRGEIRTRVNRDDARRALRLVGLYRANDGVRVRRAHERRVGLAGKRDVVSVLA